MSPRKKLSLNTGLLAGFSALYAVVLKILPGIPAYGFLGVKIQIAVVMAPIYGFILGEILGPAAILLGTLLAMLLIPSKYTVFSFFTILCAPLGALATALTLDRRTLWRLPKWIYSILIYLTLLSAWMVTDVGRATILYTAPYFTIMALIFLKGAFLDKINFRRKLLSITPSLVIGAAAGIFADHFLGSLEGIIVFRYLLEAVDPETLATFYLAAIPLVLVERGLMILTAFIILINLYLVIGRSSYVKIKLE
ncbi:MAG: hypothetical protein DRJ45_07660 [Thermoprotei archaeon]|nr:MAG: hypothetical protein DRJ45_07660 [Thermoprotei archaeon]